MNSKFNYPAGVKNNDFDEEIEEEPCWIGSDDYEYDRMIDDMLTRKNREESA